VDVGVRVAVAVAVAVGVLVFVAVGVNVGAPRTYTTAIVLFDTTVCVPSDAVILAESMIWPVSRSACVVAYDPTQVVLEPTANGLVAVEQSTNATLLSVTA
jgi:hypothetical protein